MLATVVSTSEVLSALGIKRGADYHVGQNTHEGGVIGRLSH